MPSRRVQDRESPITGLRVEVAEVIARHSLIAEGPTQYINGSLTATPTDRYLLVHNLDTGVVKMIAWSTA